MLDTREIHRLHHMETLAAIQEGMASAERGELKAAAQVLDEIRAKYGLSR
jgi:predicted transcriptional regulator